MQFMNSIWLVPQEPELSFLREQIRRIAEISGGPTFQPHITVLGGIPLRRSEMIKRIGKDIRQSPSFSLTIREFGFGDAYFLKLYLLTETSDNLSALHGLAKKKLPSVGGCKEFLPHLSLAYGDLPSARLRRIENLARNSIPIRLSFAAASIVEACKMMPVEDWHFRESIPFGTTGNPASESGQGISP